METINFNSCERVENSKSLEMKSSTVLVYSLVVCILPEKGLVLQFLRYWLYIFKVLIISLKAYVTSDPRVFPRPVRCPVGGQ